MTYKYFKVGSGESHMKMSTSSMRRRMNTVWGYSEPQQSKLSSNTSRIETRMKNKDFFICTFLSLYYPIGTIWLIYSWFWSLSIIWAFLRCLSRSWLLHWELYTLIRLRRLFGNCHFWPCCFLFFSSTLFR